MKLNIQDTFNKELPADPDRSNTPRQVTDALFSFVTPRIPSKPTLLHASEEVATLLGLSKEDLRSEKFLEVFSGSKIYEITHPYSMCYGGHQFGQWAGQLGDGRAINLFELTHDHKRWTLQLKGAGETPYSRNADGLAVLRSSIREHLCSEAMFHLGVPTTRSLSLMLTGDEVWRDMMYDGHAAYEKGAVVCRVAPTFIRFGNFEILASRKDTVNLKKLTEYTIKHFFPEIKQSGKEAYLEFFKTVASNTKDMIIHWQRVGFVHGVMNTDNMSILGHTIDYGPYGWLEGYDHGWTPNTTDRQHKRYRYGHQGNIALWNLFQLANALYPLIEDVPALEQILDAFKTDFEKDYLNMMRHKLGLQREHADDEVLINDLISLLHESETDMTIFFRNLSSFSKDQKNEFNQQSLSIIEPAFYMPEEIKGEILDHWKLWLDTYGNRLQLETTTDEERKVFMNTINPKYVFRNYMAQLAIDAADKGDYSLIQDFHKLLQQPYAEQPDQEQWFAKRPEWARTKVGCSMLSCSS